MTQTIQPCSRGLLNNAGNELSIQDETEDINSLLLAVFDSLNNLRETSNRLGYLIERKNIEKFLYQEGGEK